MSFSILATVIADHGVSLFVENGRQYCDWYKTKIPRFDVAFSVTNCQTHKVRDTRLLYISEEQNKSDPILITVHFPLPEALKYKRQTVKPLQGTGFVANAIIQRKDIANLLYV